MAADCSRGWSAAAELVTAGAAICEQVPAVHIGDNLRLRFGAGKQKTKSSR
jgi:hypothetical protein